MPLDVFGYDIMVTPPKVFPSIFFPAANLGGERTYHIETREIRIYRE